MGQRYSHLEIFELSQEPIEIRNILKSQLSILINSDIVLFRYIKSYNDRFNYYVKIKSKKSRMRFLLSYDDFSILLREIMLELSLPYVISEIELSGRKYLEVNVIQTFS